MKRNFALLLGLAVLAGCSQEEIGNNEIQNGARVPIELGAGVNTLTRTVITNGQVISGVGIAGWEVAAQGTVDYTIAATWNTTISTTANETPQAVTWTEQRYYQPGGTPKTYMKAWYPGGTLTDNKVTFENTDGSVDVLLASAIEGCGNDQSAKNLAFKHMTSQIKFSVKKGTGLAEGTTIKSITIKNAQLPNGFDLAKSIEDEGAVAYAEAADLKVACSDTEITNAGAGVSVGSPVMIKPIASNTFTVDIVTNKTSYENKTVTVTTDAVQAGYAYDITLTFGQAGIELTATVDEWKTAAGSAEIQ